MTLPTIHMNGTGAETLLADYRFAASAVEAAQEAVRKVEFNARDYYVQGPLAFGKAMEDRQAMQMQLMFIRDALLQHAVVADEWLAAREVRRAEREAV